MSSLSQFFSGSSAALIGGNIFSAITPPKMSALGNPQTLSFTNSVTENFMIPTNRDNTLGLNLPSSVTIQVANWQNTAVWSYLETGGGNLGEFFYNPVLQKYYLCKVSAGTGTMYEVNINTGALTQVGTANSAPDCMVSHSTISNMRASCLYVNQSGQYEWYNQSDRTLYRYDQTFVKIQKRVFNTGVTADANDWYYTQDTDVRCRSELVYQTNGSSPANVYAAKPHLILERYGSRRIIPISAVDILQARFRDDIYPLTATALSSTPTQVTSICPMAPVGDQNQYVAGLFYGNAVRLAGQTRNTASSTDAFLLDRDDYDRWLKAVADAMGMTKVKNFYGDWANV